jgi:hypothetical protein
MIYNTFDFGPKFAEIFKFKAVLSIGENAQYFRVLGEGTVFHSAYSGNMHSSNLFKDVSF